MKTTLTVAIATLIAVIITGCTSVSTISQHLAVPPQAKNADTLELAVDAARSVGLPPVTKLDKPNGIIEFGGFEASKRRYTARMCLLTNGHIEVIVKQVAAFASHSPGQMAKEFAAALSARLEPGS